jgi:hypothetical protein
MRRGYRAACVVAGTSVPGTKVADTKVAVADHGRSIEYTPIDTRLRGVEHRVRFAGDAPQYVGTFPRAPIRPRKAPETSRELAVERRWPSLRARECVNAWHALGIEADADHGPWRFDRVLVIGRHDDNRTARIANDDIRIERDEQRDAMLRVPARERARRGTNTGIFIDVVADPGIVQAPRRHNP